MAQSDLYGLLCPSFHPSICNNLENQNMDIKADISVIWPAAAAVYWFSSLYVLWLLPLSSLQAKSWHRTSRWNKSHISGVCSVYFISFNVLKSNITSVFKKGPESWKNTLVSSDHKSTNQRPISETFWINQINSWYLKSVSIWGAIFKKNRK